MRATTSTVRLDAPEGEDERPGAMSGGDAAIPEMARAMSSLRDGRRLARAAALADEWDEVDRAVQDALGDWHSPADLLTDPVFAAARDCADLETFRARLPGLFDDMDENAVDASCTVSASRGGASALQHAAPTTPIWLRGI